MSDESTGAVASEESASVVAPEAQQTDAEALLAAATSEESEPQEPVKPTEPEKSKEEDRFAAKFAALSRKEKQIRQREQDIERRLKEVETRAKEAEAKLAQAVDKESWKKQLQKDPFKGLEEAGLTYKELIERSIRGEGEVTPEQKQAQMLQEMNERIEKLNAEILKRDEDAKQRDQQAQMRQAQQLEKQLRMDIQKFIESKKEDLPLLSMDDDATQTVFDAIEELAKENPVSSYEDALALVDKAALGLESYYEEEISKRARHPKIQGLLGAQKPSSEPSKPSSKSATLSNSLSQSAAVPKNSANMSDDESKQYAASLLKWED